MDMADESLAHGILGCENDHGYKEVSKANSWLRVPLVWLRNEAHDLNQNLGLKSGSDELIARFVDGDRVRN